jgi:hypothetical protein
MFKEKLIGIVRQQDAQATNIDKVDMFTSFHPGENKSPIKTFAKRFQIIKVF